MDLLLDTHAFLWYLNGNNNISQKAKVAIENPKNLKFVSVASIWEIAIKTSLGKITLINGMKDLLELIRSNGFILLPVSVEHTFMVSNLDFVHRDPFDRILIAQSLVEELIIVSKDENIKKYKIKNIW